MNVTKALLTMGLGKYVCMFVWDSILNRFLHVLKQINFENNKGDEDKSNAFTNFLGGECGEHGLRCAILMVKGFPQIVLSFDNDCNKHILNSKGSSQLM